MKTVTLIFATGMICTAANSIGGGSNGATAGLLVGTLIITLSAIGNAAKL